MRKEDLWSRLAGSPELRPTTPSIVSSIAMHERSEQELTDADMDVGAGGAGGAGVAGGPAVLDSVVHLHELPEHYGFAYFVRDEGQADVQTPSGHVVANSFPVVPRVVLGERIVWVPVVSSDFCTGHRFQLLLNSSDEVQGFIECFIDATTVHRVAFVHANYSVAARAAGLVDRASLTEYNSPTNHYQKLKNMLDTLPASEVYLPVHEIATGPALHHELGAPLHIHPSHARNPTAPMAAAVWKRVCLEVNAIWDVARAATDAHNRSEVSRCGLS